MTKYFKNSFAKTGDKEAVPDDSISTLVSYETGYTPEYELNPDTDPNGNYVGRRRFNQLFADTTENIKQWQDYGYPEFVSDDGTGSPLSYQPGRIVWHSGAFYQANTTTNTVPPSAQWDAVSLYGKTAVFDSVADMVASDALVVGMSARTLGYYAPGDGGGNDYEIVAAATGTADGGGFIDLTGISGQAKGLFVDGVVNVKQFGAKGDGFADDTDACDASIAYVSNNGGGVVDCPSGIYLLGTLKEKIYSTTPPLAGYNSWALLYARDNVTFRGEGDSTVLMAANGLVATNADQPGTKGFQVFVHEEYNVAVNNFVVQDLKVYFNGYNNLVEPLNAYGNQSLVHGIYIETGNGNIVERVTWIDSPGHQTVNFGYSTTNCKVIDCRFENQGWLGGSNSNLTDHSSIYCTGTDWIIDSNIFRQPTIVPVGAAYELHGSGVASNNFSEKYAAISNIAAVVTDNVDIVLINNQSYQTGGGIGIYANGGRSLKLTLKGNIFELNGRVPTGFPLVGNFKQMFSAGENTVSADGLTNVRIESSANTYSTESPVDWATEPDDILNTFMISQCVDAVFKGDSIKSFRGAIVEQHRALSDQKITFDSCIFASCGRSNDFKTENSIVNYTNAGASDYGVRLDSLIFSGNNFFSCQYSAYMDVMQAAAGTPILPLYFSIDNDTHNFWISPIRGLASIPNTIMSTNYNVRAVPDGVKLLPSSGAIAKYCSGNIEAQYPAGWPCKFSSFNGVSQWNFFGSQFDATAPASVRPFGDLAGDEYKVLLTTTGSAIRYKCTTSGADSVTLGVWSPLTLG